MKDIMWMKVPVYFIAMLVNMLMYQIYTDQKLFIIQDIGSRCGFLNGVIFWKYCYCGLQVVDQVQVVGAENDGFSAFI